MEKLYTLSPRALWAQFRKEHFAFWMLCFYLMLQYFDPAGVYRYIAVVPWDKIVLGLTVLSWPMDPRRRWVRDSANIWMTLFLAVIVVSSALATYPSISWTHWFDFLDWYVIYFLIINMVTTAERYFIFLSIFLLANFKLSFFGARTWAARGFGFTSWGIEGPLGYFNNSSDFSSEMLMFAPIAFELALFIKPFARRVTYWFVMLGAITGAMSVLGASSRGSQVGLAVQTGWIAIQRKLRVSVLIGIMALAGVGYVLLPAAEKARFADVGKDKTSLQRLDYWKAGLKMIESHPVLGVGYYNFAPFYAAHDRAHLWHGKAQLPHNIFIQVGTDAGLIGLGIFMILIYRNLKVARDIRRACASDPELLAFAPGVARGLTITTWGFVIAGQFNTVAYYPFFWMNLALTVSLASIVKKSAEQRALVVPARRVHLGTAAEVGTTWSTSGGLPASRSAHDAGA
ncbi:MAG TPA: O-antigen ligase family protein [Steroidobacteraceae bacterium]|jgi:O-antigen ligase|nr:O-antigen ligase family protein [Steroidobacteraceae bacterium]